MTDDEKRTTSRRSHPLPGIGDGLTRRTMLQRAGGGALALSGAASFLAACGSSSSSGGSSGSTPSSSSPTTSASPDIPIATKDRPLTLPISSDNPMIASGMKPEKGPLVIYDWADYLSPSVVKSFEQKYGVTAQVTNFSSMDEAINKVNSGAITADVWVPDAQRMLQLAQAKLIQPINQSYIPNLQTAIPAAADPWYDKGSRYSTPNYINLYGVAWRNDLIKIDPASLSNPWDVYWQVPQGTPMGMINADAYTSICMSMLRSGFTNFDKITQADINNAADNLAKLTGLKLQYTAFQPLGTGVEKLAYAYNGDMVQMPHYLPKGTPLKNVSYYFPPDGKGLILNDMWVIPKAAKNPVLAHLFMNHFLEMESAIQNFRDVGYQTMLQGLTIEKLKAAKVADPYAIEMAFAPPIYQQNGIPVPLTTPQQLIWFENAFTKLSSS